MSENRIGTNVLDRALRSLVEEKGRSIYQDPDKVVSHLKKEKISPARIKQVELVLTESSLPGYLDRMDEGLSAVDLNNILLSTERTGLSDRTIRTVVSALLYGLEVPQVFAEFQPFNEALYRGNGRSLYVPPREYLPTLQGIQRKLNGKTELEKDDVSQLRLLVRADVPMAHRLFGQYLLSCAAQPDIPRGVKHLQIASDEGDAEAAALLADHYVKTDPKKAYQLYTQPGALAMDDRRQKNFLALQQTRKLRLTQLLRLAGVFVLVELFIFLMSGSPVTGSHHTAQLLCSVVNTANLIWLAAHHIVDPYRELRQESAPMLLSLLVYVLILI